MALDVGSMIVPAVAKAAGEATGKAIVEGTGGVLSEAWAALIGDRVAAFRLTNAAKLQKKVHAELDKIGVTINANKIPERYAISWFERATEQDEPEIQDLFARLLARAAEGNEDAIDRRHIETISRFLPSDAVVMNLFFGHARSLEQKKFDNDLIDPELKIDESHFHRTAMGKVGRLTAWKSIEHLTVLGVIERNFEAKQDAFTRILGSRRDRVGIPWGNDLDFDLKASLSASTHGWSLYRALHYAK